MKKVDFSTSGFNLVSVIESLGYSASEIDYKHYRKTPGYNEGAWFLRAIQSERYIEIDCRVVLEEGQQFLDVSVSQFEDPVDDLLSLGDENKPYANQYKYLEKVPFTGDVKASFMTGVESIGFNAQE